MFYVLVIIAIILGILFEKSKSVMVFQLSLIWILIGWSYGNADYQNYLTRYMYYDSVALSQRSEWLFVRLFKIGNNLGLTYSAFLVVLSFIYVVVLGIIVKKFSLNQNLVLSLYFIFPACADATQIRFAFASLIVLTGFVFLFNENIRFGELFFLICVIVATLMHIGTLLYLVMLPVRRLSKRGVYIYTLGLCILVFMIGLGGINAILSLFPGMQLKMSFMNIYTMETIKYWIIVEICIWCFFIGMVQVIRKFCGQAGIDKNIKLFNYIVKIGIVSAVTIPVTILFQDAYRIQQGLCIMYFCALSNVFPKGIIEKKERMRLSLNPNGMVLLTGCLVFASFYLSAIVLSSSNFYTVFIPYFEYNTFFDFLF